MTRILATTTEEETVVTETVKVQEKKEEAHTTGPHISIKAETVFQIGTFPVTNSLLLASFVFIAFVIMGASYYLDAKRNKHSHFFYFITYLLKELYKLYESALGDKVKQFFPLVAAFFFFILLHNWSGLLPGVGSILIAEPASVGHAMVPLFRANTADLNTTIALALIAMIYIQYIGIKTLGIKKYGHKFVNFSSPIAFFVGILEIVSELSRVLSFAFRLFGNIFAGEVLLAVVAFLIPILASFPFLLLEVFVGFIQAVVFSMLAAVLFRLAVTQHH